MGNALMKSGGVSVEEQSRRPSAPSSNRGGEEAAASVGSSRAVTPAAFGARSVRDCIDLAKGTESRLKEINRERSIQGQYKSSRRDLVGGLTCGSDFRVVTVDRSLLAFLKYGDSEAELVGKSITSLMSPLVAEIHDELFRYLRKAPPSRIKEMGSKLEYNMSNCRDFVIFDAENEPQVCGISIKLRADLSSRVDFSKSSSHLLHSVPLGFGAYINQPPELHFLDFKDVIIIMLDVSDAFQHFSDRSPDDAARFCHDIFSLSHSVILREVFPYAYIHEAIGDTIMLLVNADFMVRWARGSTRIALTAASSLQQELDRMLQGIDPSFHARAGISMGTISGGVVDGRTFRVFGAPVHLSQRLMAKCQPGKIACCKEFVDAYLTQNPFPNASPAMEDMSADLKGFGRTDFSLLLSESLGVRR